MSKNVKRHDYTINQGCTFRKGVTWKPAGVPADLTGYTSTFIANTKDETVLNLSLGNGLEIPDPLLGKVFVSLSADFTDDLDFSGATYEWKLANADETIVKRLLKGGIRVSTGEKVIP